MHYRSIQFVRLILSGALAATASAAAGAPAIDRILPPAGRQGTDVEVQLIGTDLDDPQEVFFEEGRISARDITAEGDTIVKATFTIPADCAAGPQRLRVRTTSGLSELRMFHVHRDEQIEEKEPNDTLDAAMPIAVERAVWGTLRNEDVDTFKIHLLAGGRITASVAAVRLDQQMLDPHLDLVDARGFVVAACDDHPLLQQDSMLSATVAVEGDYFLRLRESAYGGGDRAYLVNVGDGPLPSIAWPPGGAAGCPLSIEWVGDPAGAFVQQVVLPPPDREGLARLWPMRDGKMSPVPVPVRVSTAPVTQLDEPNDDPKAVLSVRGPAAMYGRIDAADDVDWIRIEAEKGSAWRITGWARRLGSPLDLVVNAHRAGDKRDRLAGNDDADGPDSVIEVTTPDDGAFLLRVHDFQKRGGADFIYWLDVEPLVSAVHVAVPPAQTKTQQRLVVAVPRGNRTAHFFTTSRTRHGDPVSLAFDDLPAGVTAVAGPFREPAPGGIVVFEASADAAPGTTMAEVSVRRDAADASSQMGGLRQRTDLVFGEPNREPYRTVVSDRLAVAVVDEAPVTIELVPPATPIVRRGLLDLHVMVHRAEGFEGRLRLELPFKPPGIGASAVDVKDGESSVRFPITAAADAAVQDWQIAIAASITPAADTKKDDKKARRAGRGSWISSRPVTLSVIEPLVDLAADKAVVDQGGETRLVFKVTKPASFQGTAKVSLLGLPVKAEAPSLEWKPGTETLEIPVRVAADAPVGKHDNIFCRIEVPQGDAWVIHQTAATSLRIDKPLPPAKEGG